MENVSRSTIQNRLLILLVLVLFTISTVLLLIASSGRWKIDALEITWQGIVDVLLALVLSILSMIVGQRARNRIGFSELSLSYNLALLLFASMLLGMWVFANDITWDVLLPGLAWRTWLLLYALPRALTLWRGLPPLAHQQIG